jgi:hypothetical protein
MVQLQGDSPIYLSPSIFKRMLKILKPMITFKGDGARNFLRERDNGVELLQEYLEDLAIMPEDI